jgi:hypothetical protein
MAGDTYGPGAGEGLGDPGLGDPELDELVVDDVGATYAVLYAPVAR